MKDLKFWMKTSQEIMREVDQAIAPLVGERNAGEVVKMGADGTPTKVIDQVAEEKLIGVLESTGRPLILVSEEIGRFEIGTGPPEVIFVADPLDGTTNAVKNIPAYGISLAVGEIKDPDTSMTIDDIELGFVENFATGDIYQAEKGGGATLNGKNITTSPKTDISQSSIGAYIYRASMERVNKLCKTVRRMRILGAVALELCYVADGTYDAFLDLRGNLRILDISAAKLILEEAGGLTSDEDDEPLQGKLNVLDRTSIVASGNGEFHRGLIELIGG